MFIFQKGLGRNTQGRASFALLHWQPAPGTSPGKWGGGSRRPAAKDTGLLGFRAESEIQIQNQSERCPYVPIDGNRPDFKYPVPFSEHVSDHMSTFMLNKTWYIHFFIEKGDPHLGNRCSL